MCVLDGGRGGRSPLSCLQPLGHSGHPFQVRLREVGSTPPTPMHMYNTMLKAAASTFPRRRFIATSSELCGRRGNGGRSPLAPASQPILPKVFNGPQALVPHGSRPPCARARCSATDVCSVHFAIDIRPMHARSRGDRRWETGHVGSWTKPHKATPPLASQCDRALKPRL
eukprot:364614-Chlamydomonas_euryale.AAC.5